MNKPTIYVDMTQLLHLQGRVTGIPRVMYEIGIRFRDHYDRVAYVSWVKEIREFCEVDIDASLSQRGHGIVYLKRGQQTPSPSVTTPSSDIVSVNVPTPLKKRAKGLVKRGIAKTRHLHPALVDRLESRARNMMFDSMKRAVPSDGDVLFVAWGEWWDTNFIAKLEAVNAAGGKVVQIMHDMAPIVVPQYSNSGNAVETYPVYCGRIFPIAKLILSVSQNSINDASVWLKANNLQSGPIKFFRLGDHIRISKPVEPEHEALAASGLRGHDFIMAVGTIELKKNHQLYYYVYKIAHHKGIDLPKMVIAGRKGWMTEATIELMTKDPDVKDKFVFVIEPSDEELAWLYEKCLFTVLASFYEGWGIPIAESLSRGVPCISSNTSSMIEVAPGFVEHFSPYSPEECLALIQKMMQPKVLMAARKKAATYQPFTWDESFEQANKYIKELT